MALRFLADHCVSGYIVESLREQGHVVERLREHLPTGASDPVVIAKAQELEAILLSLGYGHGSSFLEFSPSRLDMQGSGSC